MTALVIFQYSVLDPAKAAEYGRRALQIVAARGGAPLLLGALTTLHGTAPADRGAVFSFHDRSAAEAWYESSDYQALLPLRAEAMRCSVSLVS
jgi:uncharacterized protein (DUF1330 family)